MAEETESWADKVRRQNAERKARIAEQNAARAQRAQDRVDAARAKRDAGRAERAEQPGLGQALANAAGEAYAAGHERGQARLDAAKERHAEAVEEFHAAGERVRESREKRGLLGFKRRKPEES